MKLHYNFVVFTEIPSVVQLHLFLEDNLVKASVTKYGVTSIV